MCESWSDSATSHASWGVTAVGKTQAELAEVLGVPQSRISQIENGKIEAMELETLRAYAVALGGHLDITVSVGPHTVKVA
jgi:predicted XRE-type DNA-binding protein